MKVNPETNASPVNLEDLDLESLSPMLRLLYGMLMELVKSLAVLRGNGLWQDDPAEMVAAERLGLLAGVNHHVKAGWSAECRMWPEGAEALLQAIYNEGGIDATLCMVIRAAKWHSAFGIPKGSRKSLETVTRGMRVKDMTPEQAAAYRARRRRENEKARAKYRAERMLKVME